VVWRAADDNNYILAVLGGPGGITVYKRVAGSFTQIGSDTATIAGPQTVKVTANGNSHSMWVGGVARSFNPITESALSSNTKHGIREGTSAGNRTEYDNFSITDLAAGSASITPSTGALTFGGISPPLGLGIMPAAGALNFAGTAPTLGLGITPSAGSLSFGGIAPTVQAGESRSITPSTGALALGGTSPPLDLGITPAAGSLSLAGSAPALGTGLLIVPGTGAIAFGGVAGPLGLGITPGTGTLTLAGVAPTVTDSGNVANLILTTRGGAGDGVTRGGGLLLNETRGGGVG
jgi:hypothetical protein